MNTDKFKFSDTEYCDGYHQTERTIIGKLTPLRLQIITGAVDKFNEAHDAPYGVSPNGYRYRCGCEHDCCGHLVSESVSYEQETIDEDLVKTTFFHTKSYNL